MAVAGAQNTVGGVDALGAWLAEQRAKSAQAGMWNDHAGRPTMAGVMDAIRQTGTAVALGTGGAPERPGFTAYHGSPHQFDAFDLSKIGTGEGAQAYGHGMYLAENEGVARGYRDALSKWTNNVESHVKDITGLDNLTPDVLRNVQQVAMDTSLTPDAAAKAMAARIPALRGFDEPSMMAPKPTLEKIVNAIRGDQNPGHMYEVNVNVDPERFLHWDKPLSEQSKVWERVAGRTDWTTPDMTGARLLGEIQKRTQNDPVAAAQQLNEMGIPGIRYLDQGSRGTGEGSHNYVVFDANTMDIIRRYGLAGLMAGGGAAATQQQQPNALQAP